jgi:hypothetical protein
VNPEDIAATIYACLGLGLDAATRLADRFGRPVEIGSGGKPIEGIVA